MPQAWQEAAREHGLHIVASDVLGNVSRTMKQFDRIE